MKKKKINYGRILTLVVLLFLLVQVILIFTNLISKTEPYRELNEVHSNEGVFIYLDGIDFFQGNILEYQEFNFMVQEGILVGRIENTNNFSIDCIISTKIVKDNFNENFNTELYIGAMSKKEFTKSIRVPDGESDITTNYNCTFLR